MAMPAPTPTRRRKKKPNYWMRRLMLLLVLLLPLGLWRGWVYLNSALPIEAEGSAPPVDTTRPVYVTLIGVDEREHDIGRSDTLILVRIDPKTSRLDVVNIPRDTLVTFKSGKQSKINAAYSIDGAPFVTEVVQDLLGIPRPYYVTLNFKAFEEIIDYLGGVEIDVEKHYQYEDPYQDLYIDIPAGRQRLDGETALQYVRLRYDGVTNSDIARIERQQKFINALKERVASPSAWFRATDLMTTLRKHVKTNIPQADQLKLAQALFQARNSLKMQTLPGQPDDATGNWILDRQAWSKVVADWAGTSTR